MNAIEIQNLRKLYPDFCLDDITFTLPSGSILGLLGENGAGKSTTIQLIMNAIRSDGGSVQVLGMDNRSPEFLHVKEEIGVVLDEAYFPEVITPRNVNAIMKNTYRQWDEGAYAQYLKKFSLPDHKAFKEFSRGMKMKLAIAVALSHRPKLLLLDEATSGLDPMARSDLLDVFNDFTREADHSILFSSHIVSDLEKLCDYIAFLHRGKLLLYEEKDRLLEEYALLKLSPAALEAIPAEAIIGKRFSAYGGEALVRRALVSPAFTPEHCTLEDIIVFFAKGGDQA